jgi:hypothetical protein
MWKRQGGWLGGGLVWVGLRNGNGTHQQPLSGADQKNQYKKAITYFSILGEEMEWKERD